MNVRKCKPKRLHPARNYFLSLCFHLANTLVAWISLKIYFFLLTQLKLSRDQDLSNIVNIFLKRYFMWRKMTANSPNVFKIFKNTHHSWTKPTEPEFPQMHQYCCHINLCFELDKSCKQINIEHSQVWWEMSMKASGTTESVLDTRKLHQCLLDAPR